LLFGATNDATLHYGHVTRECRSIDGFLSARPAAQAVVGGRVHALCSEKQYKGRKLILVEGEILEMPDPNPPHDVSLGLTEAALRAAFGVGKWIRGQMSLVLGLSTDPMPDVAVVPGSPRDIKTDHPRSALLVVEISESTLDYDTRDKANLYAAGGIQEYWVVDLVHRQLIVFRDRAADPAQLFGAAYSSRIVLDAATTVGPLAAPQAVVRVGDLLP
jgi:Uma2 family endonuclease